MHTALGCASVLGQTPHLIWIVSASLDKPSFPYEWLVKYKPTLSTFSGTSINSRVEPWTWEAILLSIWVLGIFYEQLNGLYGRGGLAIAYPIGMLDVDCGQRRNGNSSVRYKIRGIQSTAHANFQYDDVSNIFPIFVGLNR